MTRIPESELSGKYHRLKQDLSPNVTDSDTTLVPPKLQGRHTVSVKSDTPLIFAVHGIIRISFDVVNEHSLGLDFLKKKYPRHFFSTGMSRYAHILAYTMAK